MKKILVVLMLACVASVGFAQRFTDKIDRGLVAVPANSGGGNLVSWRVFGEEYYDVTYNLYCDGTLVAKNLEKSNFQHTAGSATSKYQVAAVVRGVEQAKSAEVTRWANGYKQINIVTPEGRDGKAAKDYYAINDISIGDLTGDGVVEFIAKMPASDMKDKSQNVHFHHLECYDLSGNRLWWIDLGPNMSSGPDEQWDAVCYDWDQDGKAEVLLRVEDGAIIHTKDGAAIEIGNMNVDTRNILYDGELCYTHGGDEYLIYLEGATGKPYQIGPAEHPNYMDYPLPRLDPSEFTQKVDWVAVSQYANEGAASAALPAFKAYLTALNNAWGDTSGHRSSKHYWGAPFLDGRNPSIFLGRGAYTRHKFCALSVDKNTHKLTQLWRWNQYNTSSPWWGNGYHNFAIGDVDWDGRDEIIFGSMVVDDNGKGLSTTSYGHGDAQHCSDLDPFRPGEEQFACLEEGRGKYGCNFRNATTAQIYYKWDAGGDDGRALMANFTNDYPGSVGRSVSSPWISSVADKTVPELNGDSFIGWGDLNQRIYWDGDLLDEYFDSPGTEGYGAIYKPSSQSTTGGRWNFPDSKCSNWSKNNPGAIADIFGDWREELVMRKSDNTAILVYTTGIPTEYRIPTLWHDHQYRNAMVWQSMGYNQPPHKSYFLGELEGITVAPPPYTMTGRKEVANGGTISTTEDHLLVCETNNTSVSVENGASPYMVTFNIPSWVQGTAGDDCMTKKTPIDTVYYTCTVTGGPIAGATRIVKQGDGILTLPAVDMTYTGETNIWAGTVNFNGSAKNSPVWINRFGKLYSNASSAEFKSIKANYGSLVVPGGENAAGSVIATDEYYMGIGSRVKIDLYSEGFKSDFIKTAKLVIEKKDWKYGPQYMIPVIEVVEHMASGATTLEPGSYLIAHADELEGALANIKIEGVTTLKTGLRRDDKGDIYLDLGSVRGATNIVWTGAKSNVWDYATTENFYVEGDAEKTADIFVGDDVVNFTDDATSFNVTLANAVELPTGGIYVDNTKAYTIGGNGSITAGSLTKNGTGKLTITSTNSYKDGNYLKGGTVVVSSLANSTAANGNLGGLTTTSTKFTMENGAMLQTTAEVKMGSPMRMDSDEGGVINNGALFTMEKLITGTKLTKQGAGRIDMQGSLSVKQLVVAAGQFQYNTAAFANKVVVAGTGHITGTGFLASPIEVAEGAKGFLTTINRQTSKNTLTGSGQITIYCATEKGSNYYATRTPLQLNLTNFEGTIVPSAVYTADGRFTLDVAGGSNKCAFDIPSGIIVQNSGKLFKIGKLTGSGNLGGTCTFSSAGNTNVNTWEVGNADDFTYSGAVESNANFTKVGAGKMSVNGDWTTTGSVNVNAGELHLNAGKRLGTGALAVAGNATLSGVSGATASSAAKTPMTNSAITINGTIQCGSMATATTGYWSMGGKNLTLNSSATWRVGLTRCATATNPGCATIINPGKLTLADGATLSIFLNESITFTTSEEQADSFRIFSDAASVNIGNIKFELPELPAGNYWDTSRLNEGYLFVRYSQAMAVTSVPNDEMVEVEVVSSAGATVANYTCKMGAVSQTLKQTAIPGGVYLLKIKSESGKQITLKQLK